MRLNSRKTIKNVGRQEFKLNCRTSKCYARLNLDREGLLRN